MTDTDLGDPVPEATLDVTLRVNGTQHRIDVPGRRLLSDALRHDLGLTGTHVGCEHGVCGACTVLLDGRPVPACLMFAASAQGHEVTTVEGLGTLEALGPVQQAFIDCHGLQCGFCTPGFLTTITAYLEEHPDPTPEEAREAISGNLCRCTGYQNIVKAVCRAAELRRGTAEPAAADPPGGDEVVDEVVPHRSGTTARAGEQASGAGPGDVVGAADPDAPGAADRDTDTDPSAARRPAPPEATGEAR
ncbi:(2Fe-2S)-binding protein [Agilicoccus flavus]|uniref:(2Fe-2S)-binding protein n=1 Tax=Agilicoccus flavus TaxID=2775968 RepID=UPI001CF6115B|nr:(2Fe-2S)-binding protein [Agilicoccus flavus]